MLSEKGVDFLSFETLISIPLRFPEDTLSQRLSMTSVALAGFKWENNFFDSGKN